MARRLAMELAMSAPTNGTDLVREHVKAKRAAEEREGEAPGNVDELIDRARAQDERRRARGTDRDDIPPPGDESDPTQRKRSRVDPNDPRPEIVFSADQPAMTDAAIRALAMMGGIYVRGRQLVHVVRDRGAPEWMKRDAESRGASDPRTAARLTSWEGVPTIVPIEREHLPDLLGRAAVWTSIRKDKRYAASPPPWLAGRIMARGEWPFPQLEGTSDAPVFRADGTVHDRPGYDERTRIIFEPCGITFPLIPAAPTRDDARRALAELVEPFEEFPFKAECDRAAAAALVLSIIGRAAIDGPVPMFGWVANTPGSGKGLGASSSTMIPTGREAPLMAPTLEDEEMRKRLMAIALAGCPVVVIDNVEDELGSAPLAMAITAGEVSDRLLGGTKWITASLRPVWAFTGNNVRLKGDMGRRVIPIDVDPKCEHPEDRVFRRPNLLGFVRANRPRLVAAALTVLRAFVAAGRPAHGKGPKGSFEAWDALVRGAIIWAGGADPLGGVHRIREQSDDDVDRLRTLIAAWEHSFGGNETSVADAIDKAGNPGSDLYTALVAYCPRTGKPDARAIGNALRKVCGRVVDGNRFRRGEPNRIKVATWALETLPGAGSAGSAGSTAGPSDKEDRGSSSKTNAGSAGK
jgi:hypothetical protein